MTDTPMFAPVTDPVFFHKFTVTEPRTVTIHHTGKAAIAVDGALVYLPPEGDPMPDLDIETETATVFDVGQVVTVPWTRPLRQAEITEIDEPRPSGNRTIKFRYTDTNETDSADSDVLARPPSWWRHDLTADDLTTAAHYLTEYLALAESGDCGRVLGDDAADVVARLVAVIGESVAPTTLRAVTRNTDPEDCEACATISTVPCPYHKGAADGAEQMADLFRFVLVDPDLVYDAMRRRDRRDAARRGATLAGVRREPVASIKVTVDNAKDVCDLVHSDIFRNGTAAAHGFKVFSDHHDGTIYVPRIIGPVHDMEVTHFTARIGDTVTVYDDGYPSVTPAQGEAR